jgi:WD40 repeat protein
MLATNTLLQNRYLVLRPVGRGGMGTVYEATDTRLNARVALKQTLLEDKASRRAFEREAQILASLRHPALPKVIDHFADELGQFLVMEYIAGDDLALLMEKRGGGFPAASVLPWIMRWGDQLLDALNHLHSQRPPVYHRDIKPQNLKLTDRGDIILLDFGLAKGGMTDLSTMTARGDKMLGFTPNYAPLEQIRGSDPDERSDLYSLGATLYHLATGKRPPDALTRVAALLNDQDDPLQPANEVNPYITQSVAQVLQHALAANLEDRPTSAAEMRRMLQEANSRFAAASPVPPTPAPTGPVANRKRITGPLAAKQARAATPGPPGDRLDFSTDKLAAEGTIHAVDGDTTNLLIHTFLVGSPVMSLALSPDGRFMVVGGEEGSLTMWDMHSFELLRSLKGHTGGVSTVVFSPDGRYIVSGSEDKSLCLWEMPAGELLTKTTEYRHPIESIAFSSTGNLLAVGGWGGSILLYRVEDGDFHHETELFTNFVHSVAFSPDDSVLTAGCYDAMLRFWRMGTHDTLDDIQGNTSFVLAVTFQLDGKNLASAGGSPNVEIWRVDDGRRLDVLKGHSNFVRCLRYSPNGYLLASGSEDRTVRLWRVSDGEPLLTLAGHGDGVTCLDFSQDGTLLVSGSRDTKVRLWQIM